MTEPLQSISLSSSSCRKRIHPICLPSVGRLAVPCQTHVSRFILGSLFIRATCGTLKKRVLNLLNKHLLVIFFSFPKRFVLLVSLNSNVQALPAQSCQGSLAREQKRAPSMLWWCESVNKRFERKLISNHMVVECDTV